jgi:hypothetical protein
MVKARQAHQAAEETPMTTSSEPREIRIGDRVRWWEERRDGSTFQRGGKVVSFERAHGNFAVIWTHANGGAMVIDCGRLKIDAG